MAMALPKLVSAAEAIVRSGIREALEGVAKLEVLPTKPVRIPSVSAARTPPGG